MKIWVLRLQEHLRRALDMFRIRRYVHRHGNAFAREDCGFMVLVKNISRNADESWTTGRRRRNFVSVRYPFGNAITFLNEPAPFGVLLEGVKPIVQVFV